MGEHKTGGYLVTGSGLKKLPKKLHLWVVH